MGLKLLIFNSNKWSILAGIVLIILLTSGCTEDDINPQIEIDDGDGEEEVVYTDEIGFRIEDPWIPSRKSSTNAQPTQSWEPYKVDREVKGLYFTEYTLSRGEEFVSELIRKTEESVINSWVINVKNDNGYVTYSAQIPIVEEIESSLRIVRDMPSMMDRLRKHDIYPIARIVAFKDRVGAVEMPELALKDEDGNIWRDNKGDAWLNPYKQESWDYLVSIAKDAVRMGFKDIQFDYVRFPTDGRTSAIDYQGYDEGGTQSEAIADFLEYVRQELKPYGAIVSADIFGWALVETGGASVGHHLETIIPSVDIILPMVYPSHYGPGIFGFSKPDLHPYEMVYLTLESAQERYAMVEYHEQELARIRPWLQDFTASYLGSGNWMPYGVDEVLTQIQATYDREIEEWVLWNAQNNYTWDAIRKISD